MAACPAFEREPETVGVAMADLKALDREFAGVDDPSIRERVPAAPAPFLRPRGPRASGRRPREWPGHHRSSWYRRSAAIVTSRRAQECRAHGRNGHVSIGADRACGSRLRSAAIGALPSPQSTRMRSLPASTRRPGWLRSADGMLADVPRNVRSNIIEKNPPLSTFGDGPRFALHICVDGAAGPRQLLPQGTADCMNSLMAFLR